MRTLRRLRSRALLAGAQTLLVVAAATGMAALATPHAEASRFVVSSAINNSGLRFNAQSGAYMDTMVSSGSGGLTYPEGMTFGPDGNLYVRSAGNVLRYDGVTGAFMGVFVTAGGGADANNQSFQVRFDQSQGSFVVTPASGGLDGPTGLTFGPDGNLYVSSYGLVLRYSGQTGLPLGTFASGGGLVNATGVTFGPDGNLYVSCYPGNKILRYNGVTGAFIDTFVPTGLGGLDRPIGLAFGPGNQLFVCSYNTNRVLRYNGSTGSFLGISASGNGLNGPTGLAFGPDGNLYVTSYNTDAVLRFDATTAAFIDNFVPTGSHGLDGPFCPVFMLQAPINLTTAVQSFTRIDLSWTDTSEDETGYEIDRKTAGGAYAPVAVIAAGSTGYQDNSLAPNTAYSYRVRGVYGPGASAFTNESAATTPANPPAAPTNLTVNLGQPKELVLNWQDNSGNELAFEVFRKTSGSSYQKVATLAANTVTYTDTGLTPGFVWTYQVRSTNNGGPSNFTNEAGGMPLPPPPPAPSGLTATAATSTQINLTWTDNSSGENSETAFSLYRKTGAADYTRIATLAANTTSYSDTGLSTGTTYSYLLRASNDGGTSGWSNGASASTPEVTPAAPTVLSATVSTPTQIDLTWNDNSNNETGFDLYRKIGARSYVKINTCAANATAFSDTTASPNTSYTYRLQATNSAGVSGWTNEVTVTTPEVPPAAPTALDATVTTPTQIDLAWTDNSDNETGFDLYRKIGAGSYVKIATAGANATAYSDTTATPNTTYTYRLQATNDAGASDWTNEVLVSTPEVPPADPTVLTATVSTPTKINLTWNDNSNNETAFALYRKVGAGSYVKIATCAANATAYSDATATPNTSYTYRLQATNDAGVSGWTNEVTVTTPEVPPADPINLAATVAAPTKINLTWQDMSNNETAFALFRKVGAGTYVRIAVCAPNAQAYSDTTVSTNTTYTYKIRATNNVGASNWTNEVTVTTPEVPPAAPTGLTAGMSPWNQVNLKWSDNSNNEKAFAIFRKTATTDYVRIAVTPPNATAYADTTVSASTGYTYRIRATNNVGASNWTNEVSVTISGPPPAAPTALTGTVATTTRVNLAWNDNSNNETAFAIFRKTATTDYVRIAVTAPNSTVYADTTVSPSTTYTYRVRAVNNYGASAWTNEVTVTTDVPATISSGPPASPTNLTATAVSSTKVNLTWKDNSNNETAFSIFRKTGTADYVRIAVTAANAQAYSDTTASANTTYTYKIRATNNVGASNWTNEVTVTTNLTTIASGPPASPTNLTATAVSSTKINLTWKDNSNNETAFSIFRKIGTGSYVRIAVTAANAQAYSDTTASANTTYTYKIRATNNVGASNWTNEVTVTTPH